MKLHKWMVLSFLTAIIFSACSQTVPESASDTIKTKVLAPSVSTQPSDHQVDPMQEWLTKRCKEITSCYDDLYEFAEKTASENSEDAPILSQNSIDAIENRLRNAGYDVIDTNGAYPSYLSTSDRFYNFWDSVTQREPAEQEVMTISDTGNLSYCLFTYREDSAYFYRMVYVPDGVTEPYFEKHQIQDWELTEKGNFYFRIFPANNKHYADYTLIRLIPPNIELYDMTLRYILPVNYLATNLFLTDWTESDFSNVSFNDLFEHLYYSHHGSQVELNRETFTPNRYGYEIPAAEFEKIIMPYFNIDIETLRKLAHYQAEGDYYPWRALETNDFAKLWYYTIEPEVTGYTIHADGTMTLTVEVLSTDLKTDCLFAHEVTIRPLENGQFQYVGNHVTYQTEYGLPYCEPRLNWGR